MFNRLLRYIGTALVVSTVMTCCGLAQVHTHQSALSQTGRAMTMDWHKVKPEGNACRDVTGSPADVKQRAMSQNCSTVVIDTNRQTIFFVNWTTVGNANALAPLLGVQVLENIKKEFGDKYVVFRQAGSAQQQQKIPAILHYSKNEACDDVIEGVDIVTLEQPNGRLRVSALMADPYSGGKTPIDLRSSPNRVPWVELPTASDPQLTTEPLARAVAAIKATWNVEVRGRCDHASWRRAVSENLGLPLDGIQPKPGHAWKECYSTFRGKSTPFDR